MSIGEPKVIMAGGPEDIHGSYFTHVPIEGSELPVMAKPTMPQWIKVGENIISMGVASYIYLVDDGDTHDIWVNFIHSNDDVGLVISGDESKRLRAWLTAQVASGAIVEI